MSRVDVVRQECNLGLFQSTDVVRCVSNLIADEIEGYAQFLEVEGDIYGMVGGLRKAIQIVRNYDKDRLNNE